MMEFEQLVTLIQTVSDSTLTGFKYEENGIKLSMSREKDKVAFAAAGAAIPAEALQAVQAAPQMTAVLQTAEGDEESASMEDKPGRLIKSPLVGTFYAAPSEEAEPFVEAGASVKKGQTIAIVEAMKLMNDIESEFDGTVAEVLVANGEAVEYGQPLFRIV